MKIILNRFVSNEKQTIGSMAVIDNNKVKFVCHTLELPDLNNQNRISCIPVGVYDCEKRYSPKFKNHFHILNVPNRSYILIHKGNYHSDILGCVLVGSGLKDINKDGYMDVINSSKTMDELLSILPDKFKIEVR